MWGGDGIDKNVFGTYLGNITKRSKPTNKAG
ncbi:hypothetical protein FAES_pFAES01053 (plasmid) [Fibrella aestuarina BUZ 2]|uniref:Uncharacterized protein n=1 Tax=Fibrella aestuarina BUZ 2 TaxID=1166018 RepID=I0KHE4_9BACT|nr:hypothetical protein FAES_pFAES01053 [Fibrella aestuarina BUZ 2]